MKVCRWCEQTKPLDEFYPHARMADGHLNKCKTCVKAYVSGYREANPSVQERDRRRYHEGKKSRGLSTVPTVVKQAQNAVNNAIRDGKITRPNQCEQCSREGVPIEAAHSDYTKPLDVRWLCRRCHRIWDSAEPKIVRVAS